jgi:hypothetical protein
MKHGIHMSVPLHTVSCRTTLRLHRLLDIPVLRHTVTWLMIHYYGDRKTLIRPDESRDENESPCLQN